MPSLAVERARKSAWLILILRCGFKFPLGLPNARPLCSLRIFLCVAVKKDLTAKRIQSYSQSPPRNYRPFTTLFNSFFPFYYQLTSTGQTLEYFPVKDHHLHWICKGCLSHQMQFPRVD